VSLSSITERKESELKPKIMNRVIFYTIVKDEQTEEERQIKVSEFHFASLRIAKEFFDNNFGQAIIDGFTVKLFKKCGCVTTRTLNSESGEINNIKIVDCLEH
jgi:hypothetical protein